MRTFLREMTDTLRCYFNNNPLAVGRLPRIMKAPKYEEDYNTFTEVITNNNINERIPENKFLLE